MYRVINTVLMLALVCVLSHTAIVALTKEPYRFSLPTTQQLISLPDSDQHTLAQIGVDFASTRQHTVIMRDAPHDTAATTVVAPKSAVGDASVDSTTTTSPLSNTSFDDIAATSPPLDMTGSSPMDKRSASHIQMELHLGKTSRTSSPTSSTTPLASAGVAPKSTKFTRSQAAAAAAATANNAAATTTNTKSSSSSSPPAASAAPTQMAAICAPPPPPPGATTNGDDSMDVDHDHQSSDGGRRGGAQASSTAGGMLMLYAPSQPSSSTSNGFVGLVNQAMTCYLNSLLQALFMTPEFRNAMYKWEYKPESDHRRKSIPFELQKLFLQLQTSARPAVETTDLTRSFGWDSSEAWQQHDVQELCRVMFDALEHTFKRTDQKDLINRLYEGKMIDYVRCLECQTEKSREDAFLDIPLPVRPFGSQVAYDSIEEALRGFVEPERLDETNQYFCEKCNCKCDAHKGLKFARFPYILTLHLKRFDFDYQTFHRIKLNDK